MSVKDLPATRTVVLRFPDGNTQYWLTDRIFTRGETLRYLDRDWLVSHVSDPADTNGYSAFAVLPLDEAAG